MRTRAVLLLVLVMAALLALASPAWAATFTVNSTADMGDATPGDGSCFTGNVLAAGNECTLRAAIQEANANGNASNPDRIHFAIPTRGVATISPASELPPITQQANINGYSQQGTSVNTSTIGTNAVLKVVLDGSNAGSQASGLVVKAPNSSVKGLVIDHFNFGVLFDGATASGMGRTLEGSFIGTGPSGTQSMGKSAGVVVDDGVDNVVGGATLAARNLISGNDTGISLNSAATGNSILGNLIGTDKSGTSGLGNRAGIQILGGSNNTIGGAGAAGNTIAFNRSYGVQVQALPAPSLGIGNSILSNSIFENGGLGIQLGADSGVTANDPMDTDTGANRLQNYPLITSAITFGSFTTIKGTLDSIPSTTNNQRTFTIQFFSNPEKDPSGFGEGKTFLGQTQVSTNSQGKASFSFGPAQKVFVGQFISATATRDATGDTSEFSKAKVVEPPPVCC